METKIEKDPVTGDGLITTRVSPMMFLEKQMAEQIFREAVGIAAERIAAAFYEAHAQDVLAAIKPEAIATLAAANAAAEIKRLMEKKLDTPPPQIIHTRTVERKGFFESLFG